MSTTWWPAPAKLNLFLHVIGRRPDGYHELQTAFQFVDLADDLSFDVTDDGLIERHEAVGRGGPRLDDVPPEFDLCVLAAQLLRSQAGGPLGCRIRIRKRIPLGGGLGGGSSDAATTLRVLNRLWRLDLPIEHLAALGLQLGADVPVFVGGRSAFAEGIGERLSPLCLPEKWFLIVHPRVSIPTHEIFQSPELTRNSPVITIATFLASGGRNDLEPVVRARHPAVGEALDWLGRFAPARLTGTGSCVFASFDSAVAAERIAARVPDLWRAYVCRGLDRSPLSERLEPQRLQQQLE